MKDQKQFACKANSASAFDVKEYQPLWEFAKSFCDPGARVMALMPDKLSPTSTFHCDVRLVGEHATERRAYDLIISVVNENSGFDPVRILDTACNQLTGGGTLVLTVPATDQYHLNHGVPESPSYTIHHLRAMLLPYFSSVEFHHQSGGYAESDFGLPVRPGPGERAQTFVAVCRKPKELRPCPRVSIIMPLFSQCEYTLKAISAISANTGRGISYEVVLVNNASSDESRSLLKGLGGDVVVINNKSNLGFAVAANQGALAARGEVLVFLNNDTEVHPLWSEPLLDELESHPDTGVAGARLLYPDGTIQHAGVAISRDRSPVHMHKQFPANHPLVMERREFPIVTAACSAVRRDEFLSLGMFDEGFDNGQEDIDLCLRYGSQGKRSIYRPESVVTHYESKSEGRLDSDRCRRNRSRTLLKWRDRLMQDDFNYCCTQAEQNRPANPLRWAIKIGPPDRSHTTWGDVFYAESLARELVRLGHSVRIDYQDEWGRDDLIAKNWRCINRSPTI